MPAQNPHRVPPLSAPTGLEPPGLPSETSARAVTPRRVDRHAAWRRLAPLGLMGVGAGASAVGQAAIRKASGQSWVLYGTAALCVLNAGLCCFGEAVKQRALLEWEEAEGR